MTKFNLKITAKCHAHLQTLSKTPEKFQKDATKIVGVAFKRVCTICDGQSNDPAGGRHIYISGTFLKSLSIVVRLWFSCFLCIVVAPIVSRGSVIGLCFMQYLAGCC